MNKQKGYILVTVLIYSLVLSFTLISTFAIVYRYHRYSIQQIQQLREVVYVTTIIKSQGE